MGEKVPFSLKNSNFTFGGMVQKFPRPDWVKLRHTYSSGLYVDSRWYTHHSSSVLSLLGSPSKVSQFEYEFEVNL